MSTCPGTTLEKFLMWNFDLIVDDDASANLSLQLAEAIGTSNHRKRITAEQFSPVVTLFEPYRDEIEQKLRAYSEDECGSWRDYAYLVAENVPLPIQDAALAELPPRP